MFTSLLFSWAFVVIFSSTGISNWLCSCFIKCGCVHTYRPWVGCGHRLCPFSVRYGLCPCFLFFCWSVVFMHICHWLCLYLSVVECVHTLLCHVDFVCTSSVTGCVHNYVFQDVYIYSFLMGCVHTSGCVHPASNIAGFLLHLVQVSEFVFHLTLVSAYSPVILYTFKVTSQYAVHMGLHLYQLFFFFMLWQSQ